MATLRRNSRQRMLVYDAVKASHEHPNAEEVYQVSGSSPQTRSKITSR